MARDYDFVFSEEGMFDIKIDGFVLYGKKDLYDIVIPNKINGKHVIKVDVKQKDEKIGSLSFEDNPYLKVEDLNTPNLKKLDLSNCEEIEFLGKIKSKNLEEIIVSNYRANKTIQRCNPFEGNTKASFKCVGDKVTEVDGAVYTKDKTTLLFVSPSKKGDFEIPFGVTKVCLPAMIYNNLTKIKMPRSVGSIEWFDEFVNYNDMSPSLKSIEVDKANKRYVSYDGVLFSKVNLSQEEILFAEAGIGPYDRSFGNYFSDGIINNVGDRKDFVNLRLYPKGKESKTYALPTNTYQIRSHSICGNRYLQNLILNEGLKFCGDINLPNVNKLKFPQSISSIGELSENKMEVQIPKKSNLKCFLEIM